MTHSDGDVGVSVTVRMYYGSGTVEWQNCQWAA